MEAVGLIGFSAFVIASLVVGVRLLHLASRTGQLPETTIGLSFLLAGGIGGGLNFAGSLLTMPPSTEYVVRTTALAASLSGYALLAFFVWRVFREKEAWALVAFMACAGILFASFVARVAGDNLAGTESREIWFWLSLAAQTVIYVWATTESSLYYLKLRRRQRLGLAEPLLAQRFLLWGIGTGAVALIWVYQALTTLLMSPEWLDSAANFAPISLLGFVCAVSIWFAFFPPSGYAQRFSSPTQEA